MEKIIMQSSWYKIVQREINHKQQFFLVSQEGAEFGPFDNVFMPHNSVFAVQKNNKYNFIYKWKYISGIWFDDIAQNYFSDNFYALVSFGNLYLKVSANGHIADMNDKYMPRAKLAKSLLKSTRGENESQRNA